MRKTMIVLILITVSLFHRSIFAEEPDDSFFKKYAFGVGVIAGVPTGLTFKYNAEPEFSIDGGVGWEVGGDNEFHIYSTCIFYLYDIIHVPKGKLPFYLGGGLRIVQEEDNKVGIRLPVGTEYQFQDLPLGAFVEVVPVLNIKPDTDFDLEGGAGIRYFF